jgi:hypothetical protein
MPVTATQPTTTTVTAIRSSRMAPTADGPNWTSWMCLMTPECSAESANDSMVEQFAKRAGRVETGPARGGVVVAYRAARLVLYEMGVVRRGTWN